MKVKNDGLLVVVSGPSGAGKGTVIKKYMENKVNTSLSISMTTRKPRPGEVDGVDYFFVTKEQFEKEIKDGNLLEYASYNDNYYGTPKKYVESKISSGKDIILEIEIQGAMKIKESNEKAIFVFIMPPSLKELLKRLVNRKTETLDKVLSRFITAYKEINEAHKYNYIIINDSVEQAAIKLDSIINAEKCRIDRIEDFDLGTAEEIIHETLIDDGETLIVNEK